MPSGGTTFRLCLEEREGVKAETSLSSLLHKSFQISVGLEGQRKG